jgi:dihydrofolate reductase
MAKKGTAATTRRPKNVAGAAGTPRGPLFRAALAVSVDGFIAPPDGSTDWLRRYFSLEIDFADFMRTIGATVYGRATYDLAVAQGHGLGRGGTSVVLTHRPPPDPPPGVAFVAGDVRALAQRLRSDLAGSGRDVWLLGGGRSIACFHEHGLVDRWELAIIPVLLGDGIPLFPRHSRGPEGLRLMHSRTLHNGIVEVWYEHGHTE